jgi:hypothetical protein
MFGRKILRELNAQRAERIADNLAAERRVLQITKVVTLYSSLSSVPRSKIDENAASLDRVIAGHQTMEDTVRRQARNIRAGLPLDFDEPATP